LPAALALHAKERFDVIYATGGPYSTYLLARQLSTAAGVPYVADMRDAWLQRPMRAKGSVLAEARAARQERKMLLGAAAVVFATEPMEAAHLRAYPDLMGRTDVVINGFDHADYPEMRHPGPVLGPGDPVIFANTGTLNSYIRPECLLDAFRAARASDEAFRRRARLRLIGNVGVTAKEREEFATELAKPGLDGALETYGYRAHPEAVLLQRTADALTLITSGRADEQCGKTAEYLAAGRPILAMVVEGTPAAEMVALAERVERARPDDRAGVAAALLRLFREADGRRAPDPLPVPRTALSGVTRKAGAEKMAAVFERVRGRRP
jgi:glycosyltransferase involved in cell wall biosynthesis